MLDASALLAALLAESGHERVLARLPDASISAVNWSEVAQRVYERSVETEAHATVRGVRARLEAVGTRIVPFGTEDAEEAARLRPATRSAGLSLGDRACLALARRLGLPALTADRTWGNLAGVVGAEVEVIR